VDACDEDLPEDGDEGGVSALEGLGDENVENHEEGCRALGDNGHEGRVCEQDQHENINNTTHQEDRVVHVLRRVGKVHIIDDGVVSLNELRLC